MTYARPAHPVRAASAWLALAALHSPLRFLLEPGIAELTYSGRQTAREIRLPVMFARNGNVVAVLVGGAHRKTWWRNFGRPWPLQVSIAGQTYDAMGVVAKVGTPEFDEALTTYRRRFPHVHYRPGDQLVVIRLAGDH